MCLGENSAHHAVHYVNAQLGALWDNATQCVHKVGKDLKPLERVRYDFALAEFHAGSRSRSKTGSKDETMFSAVFNKPRLDFICNHEAVLYLHIKSGHVNLDFAKADSSGFVINRGRNIPLDNVEVAFRVEFGVNGIRGHTSKIGQGSHIIQLLVLDLHSAQVASKIPTNIQEALPYYLRKYLDFLHHAGQHVLFSLPDFDDDRLDIIIDYSLDSHQIRNVDVEVDEVFGVSLDQINKQLSSRWLKAILDNNDGANRSAICLAEYRSNWTSLGDHTDLQFHVKFGAPKIKALCKREIILYFNIDELLIYNDTDFTKAAKHTYSDWQIAVVVDLIKEVENTITRVKLDLSTLRVCEHLSIFKGYDATVDWAVKLKSTFIEFIDYYAAVLEDADFHHIYVVDVSETDIKESSESEEESSWREVRVDRHRHSREEIVKKSYMYGFDFIQAISQYTIIEHFKSLWVQARDSKNESLRGLYQWSYNEDFKGTFGAFTLRILPNGKAIIWINLDEGSLKPLRSTTAVEVSGWSVAFEVGFTLVDQEDVGKTSSSWLSRFTNSFAWKQHGTKDDRTLKHLCLDFSQARFVYELSKFESLSLGNHSAVTHVMGAVHYLTNHYFSHLVQNGFNILHSIPVWKAGSKPPHMGLTKLTFQVYSKHDQHIIDYRHLPHGSEAVIVLLGMTGFRELPSIHLPYTTDLIPKSKGNTAHGTIVISRKQFLEERLLTLLAQVNTTSTIVPIFPGADDVDYCVPVFTGQEGGHWELALTTWARRYRNKTRRDCGWELKEGSRTDYKWDHTDKWNYEHEGAHNDRNNGLYTVVCVTKNHLSLPKAPRQSGMDINLSGNVTIQLGFKGRSSSWSSRATASWSVTLSLNSLPRGGGIAIDVKGETRPRFETHSDSGEKSLSTLINMNALHNLLNVDLSDLTSELKQSFGGAWEHCFPGTGAYSLNNPIFNNHGDIMFELRPYVPSSASSAPAPKSRPSVTAGRRVSLVSEGGDAVPVPRPAPAKKSKSFLQRVGDGIVNAGQTIGDIAEDVTEAVIGGEKHSEKHDTATAKVERPSVAQLQEHSFSHSSYAEVATPHVHHGSSVEIIDVPPHVIPAPAHPAPAAAKAEGNGHGNGSAASHAEGNGHGHGPVIVDTKSSDVLKEVKSKGSGFFKSKKATTSEVDVKQTAR